MIGTKQCLSRHRSERAFQGRVRSPAQRQIVGLDPDARRVTTAQQQQRVPQAFGVQWRRIVLHAESQACVIAVPFTNLSQRRLTREGTESRWNMRYYGPDQLARICSGYAACA